MGRIIINNHVSLRDSEVQFKTAKSSGPGGQHVNTSNTKALLIWSLEASTSLSVAQKDLLSIQLGNHLSKTSEVKISSGRFRSLERNKQDCIDRFIRLINKALQPPKKRKKTRVSKNQKAKRLDNKKRRSELKKSRNRSFES